MNSKGKAMQICKELNSTIGINMIESMLEKFKDELPDGKTIQHFGGGYVEMLKTKAKVVLYFGFDSNNNRVSISFQVKQEDVLLWTEAIAEKIWNKGVKENIVSFDKNII